MQHTVTNIIVSYFVIIGVLLLTFNVLHIDAALWQGLLIALIFTIVATLLHWHQGGHQWTPHESENFSTTETPSTAS
jgi:hypothetical protein